MTSGYGAGEVTPAARIAEILCERVAAHEGVHLPPLFWRDDGWKKRYTRVIQSVHSVLKIYQAEAVLAALEASPRVRSLVPEFARELVRAEQSKIDARVKRAETAAPIEERDTGEAPRQGVKKAASVRARLRDL